MATVTIQTRKRAKRSSYCIYYKDPATGKKLYYKTFPKKTEAQKAANNLRILIDNGKMVEVSKVKEKPQIRQFRGIAENLIAKWETAIQSEELSPITGKEYVRLANQLCLFFKDRLLAEISENDVRSYINNLAEKTSNVNSNRHLFVMKQIFQHGVANSCIEENPVRGIKKRSEKKHERNNFLTATEINTLVSASRKTRGKYYLPAMIYLAAEHGTAIQEVLSLKWSDIVFDTENGGSIRFFRTKNKRERTAALMPRTKEALLEWRNHLEVCRKKKDITIVDDNDFIFTRQDGRPLNSIKKSWVRARELAGFEDLHFHDLRHTFCSNLLMAGATLKDVKEMIGHDDLSMTDRYTHLTDARQMSLLKKLASHYGEDNPSNT